ncbi:MAG: RNA polymerase sigma factor [Bacteroidales bacterium]|nr:RNA polymerase sigma factor [Bacteroidales bacterium]
MEATGDHQNIERFLSGDRAAFVALVQKYQDMVFTLSLKILKNREEAEEVAQDVFMKVYDSLDRFQGKSKFSTWVYRIAYNQSLNYLKSGKKNRGTTSLDSRIEYTGNHEPDAFHTIQNNETNKQIQKALLHLPETDQIIVTLFYYEDLSVKEIADIVDLSVQNVKVKLHRSRQKLYAELKDKVTT